MDKIRLCCPAATGRFTIDPLVSARLADLVNNNEGGSIPDVRNRT